MKNKKFQIGLVIYLVAIIILILSSLINPSEKYIVAFLLIVSFPVVFKKIYSNNR